jgi:hypothetical protein
MPAIRVVDQLRELADIDLSSLADGYILVWDASINKFKSATNNIVGALWRVGSGVPSNSLGIDGDFYLDTATSDVYSKASGVYTLVANIKGEPGGSIFTHYQGAPSMTWTIDHNLNRKPHVTFVDSLEQAFVPFYEYTSNNQIVARMSIAVSGEARIQY